MTDALTMTVLVVNDIEYGDVYGAPSVSAGELIEVPFSLGARLVAAEYAVVPEDDEE